MKNKTLIRNAVVLSLGGFFAKGLGALYKIPLANFLGGYGTGLYQMAYPLFCVLLTFSSSGFPNAFARLIAREYAKGREGFSYVKTALGVFLMLGLCGSILMCLLAPVMATLQGEKDLVFCYFALAPSVFLVSAIAVFRGYFQGGKNMYPTVFSELFEQVFKITLGLLFAMNATTPLRAAQGALFAVTLSESCALLYLFLRYKRERGKLLQSSPVPRGEIVRSALPAMTSSAILPLSQTLDSILLVRLLATHTPKAIALYGLFSGGITALLNLPASIAYGFSVASVPALSEAVAEGDWGEGKTRAMSALFYTLLLSVPCALGLFLFATPVVNLLFSALSQADKTLLVLLLRTSAVSAVTLSCTQTLSACLTGMGRAKFSALSMAIAVAVKHGLQFALVGNPRFSILGAVIASDTCYLLAFLLDLYYTMRVGNKGEKHNDYARRFRGGKGRLERAGAGGGKVRR